MGGALFPATAHCEQMNTLSRADAIHCRIVRFVIDQESPARMFFPSICLWLLQESGKAGLTVETPISSAVRVKQETEELSVLKTQP